MSESSQSVRFLEMLHYLRRWWWAPVSGTCLGLTAGLLAYALLPKTYEVNTKMFVSSSEVPQHYVKTVVGDDMAARLRSLRDAVVSQPYLETVVSEVFGVRDPARRAALVSRLRSQVSVFLLEFDDRRGAGLFQLTYRGPDPQRAVQVVNSLARRYMDENVRQRTEEARTTVEALERLSDASGDALRRHETAVTEFRARHLHELPDQLATNMQLLGQQQAALDATERAYLAAQDRLQSLSAQRALVQPPAGTSTRSAAPVTIEELRNELAVLRTTYTELHPLVLAAQRKLEALEQVDQTGQHQEEAAPAADSGPADALLRLQMEAQQREIARLEDERRKIHASIDVYRARVEATPVVDAQLTELTKGLEGRATRHREYLANCEEAKGALMVEQSRKTSRFDVVEPAVAPNKPIRPRPVLVYLAGLSIGLLLLPGPLVVREFLRPRLLSEVGLAAMADVPVLACIHELQTPEVVRERRRRLAVNLPISILSAAALVTTFVATRS